MDWFGRAKISFTHHATPLTLQQKDGTTTDLLKVVEQATPPCQLNPLLFNGHVQTMWTVVKEHGPQIYYRRKIFDSDHKVYTGSFTVDFVTEPHQDFEEKLPPRTAYFSEQAFANLPSDDNKPMLIVLHGLSGGSHEIYLRHAILPLVESGKWEICVVNSRGCANSAVTSGLFFNARATWDVRQVVKWARKNFPNRPLFGVGFSLGANILTNVSSLTHPVKENGSKSTDIFPTVRRRRRRGMPPEECHCRWKPIQPRCYQQSFAENSPGETLPAGYGKYVQSGSSAVLNENIADITCHYFTANMKKLVANHKETVLKYTKLDYDRIQNITYLNEFDREVQTVTWGYPTEDAYYRDASSSDAVLGIRIPFMALSAADDPVRISHFVVGNTFRAWC